MSEDSIVIVGTGIICAVGVSTAEAAAAVRGGIARFNEINFFDRELEPFTVAEVRDDALSPLAEELSDVHGLTARELRMLRLATRPLLESVATVQAVPDQPGLVLALPDWQGNRPTDYRLFLRCLAVQTRGAFALERSDCSLRGRAGGIQAIGHAVELLHNGHAGVVMAGGVDTYRDVYALGALDLEGRVKSTTNLDGFVPGEAAAFVTLARREIAVNAGMPVLTGISTALTGFEPGHLYSDEPYRGQGLADVVSQLVRAGVVDSPIEEVYSSMNGENFWAKEWGVAFSRNRAAFRPNYRIHHPADSIGDTGAACGPLMAALAAHGLKARYRSTPSLIYGSSDDGPRAAIVLNG